MPVRFKWLSAFLPLVFAAFMPNESIQELENHYNFSFLRDSAPPREAKILRIDEALKRQVVESGVLVTYKNREAKKAAIAGDFSHWKPVRMTRGRYGVWHYFIKEFEAGKSCRYKLIVDDIWMADPKNFLREDDGMGSYVSIIQPLIVHEGTQLSYRVIGKNRIEFRLYKPHARMVSLVGDFNGWNPENDLLRKGRDGIWRLTKRLSAGTYRYKFIIDGTWSEDLYNRDSASDDTGRVCSRIRVE